MSDLHVGFKHSRAKDILHVLETTEFDRLILVGDIFDIQQMMKRPFWDKHHTAVLKKILKIAKQIPVVYVIGNHDYPLFYLQEYTNKLAGIKLCREYVYKSGDKTILCIHGDQMDNVNRQIQLVGDFFYATLLRMNSSINYVRRLVGRPKWSFSKWCKDKAKQMISRAFNMDEKKQQYLKEYNANILVYGHTHMPMVTDSIVNTGSFVEIATYVIEQDGIMNLIDLDKNTGV